MTDPWPEPTDEELPDDSLPGGPEDGEHVKRLVMTD
jgi:hypothetical protein